MADKSLKQLKYNKARLAIMNFIAQSGLKVGEKLPSERDLVNQLSCSSITMRHALADLESDGLIERRHGSGTYLSREIRNEVFRCNILLVFVYRKEEEDLPGWGMDRLRRYLADRGIGLSYVAVTEFGLEVLNAAKDCIGIITGGWLTPELIAQLKTLNLPMIIQGNTTMTTDVPSVSLDIEQAAYRLTCIMAENGRRNIALFRGPDDYAPALESERGYRKAIQEKQLPELIMKVNVRFTYNERIEAFMDGHPEVDAILMEHAHLSDFIAWCWRTDYKEKPAIGFLSKELDHKKYRQSDNFLWTVYENISVKTGQVLLDHIVYGKQLKSLRIPPFIPSVDNQENYFIS